MAVTEQEMTRKEQMLQRLKELERKIATKKVVGPAYALAKGLSITLKTMMRRSVTVQYPKERPDIPPRSRGVIALKEENCTVCMLCSRECPDWCIYIDSHKDVMPPKTPGARPRTRNVLDRFAIDYALCMYCGICVEVCPFDALFWAPHFEYSVSEIDSLTHEMSTLAKWMDYVPAPLPLEEGAEPPKELAAELKFVEAAGAVAAPPPAAAAAPPARAPAEAPAAEAPATEAPATEAPAAEAPAPAPAPAAEDHEPPATDEETYQRELAAGKPERIARALAKKASILKKRGGG